MKVRKTSGLKDKYGKEVFEGDILASESEKDETYTIVKVCCFWKLHTKIILDRGFIVVGNIYDNPELLK